MANTETAWWSKDTVAVVTGGNKGIGFEIVRAFAEKGLTVVLTARDQKRGEAALDALKAKGLKSVVFHALDIGSPESAKNLAAWLKKEFGGIDILVNNAGVVGGKVSYDAAKDIIDTNYRGTKNVTKALLPLLRASPAGGRIITVSSRMGLYDRLVSESLKKPFQDEENYSEELVESLATEYLEDVKAGHIDEKGWVPTDPELGKNPIYSESKMFLNVYSSQLAKSLSKSQPQDHQIFVATFCPGVTKTDMYDQSLEAGFKAGDLPVKTVAEGADTGVWLALLPKEELAPKNGKFFGERTEYSFGWVNPPF